MKISGSSLHALEKSVGLGWVAPGLFLAAGVIFLAILGVVSVPGLPITPLPLPFLNTIINKGSRAFEEISSVDDVVNIVDNVEKAFRRGKEMYEELTSNEL